MIELEKDVDAQGLGIRLTGNKSGSRARMSVYVEHIDPAGPAALDGRIRVGDELLEVRNTKLCAVYTAFFPMRMLDTDSNESERICKQKIKVKKVLFILNVINNIKKWTLK